MLAFIEFFIKIGLNECARKKKAKILESWNDVFLWDVEELAFLIKLEIILFVHQQTLLLTFELNPVFLMIYKYFEFNTHPKNSIGYIFSKNVNAVCNDFFYTNTNPKSDLVFRFHFIRI